MKIKIAACILAIGLLMCSCEADRSLPVFLHGDTKQIYDEPFYDVDEYTGSFIAANYYWLEPLADNEQVLFGGKKGYVSCSDAETSKMREATFALLQACYNNNYPYKNQLEIAEPYLDPKLYSQVIQSEVFDNRRRLFEKYNGTTVLESVDLLPYYLVCTYGEADEEVYRLWIKVNADHSADDKAFYENSHYVYGSLFLELYVYFKYDRNDNLKIVSWDEVNISPNLEVIYTQNAVTESTNYESKRYPFDNVSPASLTKGYGFIDVVEFPLHLKKKILRLVDDLISLPSIKNTESLSKELNRICTPKLAAELSSDEAFSVLDNAKALHRCSEDLKLYIYSKMNQEYLFATVPLSMNDTGYQNSIESGKNGQEKYITCILLPLDQGEFLIDQYLLYDIE